ncbi:DUF3499 family protein, partial [Leifsonia sp. SIMBA_070]
MPIGAAFKLVFVTERICSKVSCSREAVATLTFDYEGRMVALGPLGAGDD